ncbi:MAG: adenylate/guanylate cyclase domain-containing protein [Spirochaetales bacterium]|nr:adenylate/guanylate cyclase domain-containing protein [Spirochaetales bacterium]
MKKNKKVVIIFLILSLLAGCSGKSKSSSRVLLGEIDVSSWNFSDRGFVALDGDWEFYWGAFIQPEDFRGSEIPSSDYIAVPGDWKGKVIEGLPLEGNGYATYRILVSGLNEPGEYGLRIPYHFSSYRLFLNGKEISKNGVVGENKESSIPQTVPKQVYFSIDEDSTDIELVLHISNFAMNKGGPLASYRLGTAKQIRSMTERAIFFDVFIAACLFIMGLYHLGLFFLRRAEKSPLYFGLLCLLLIPRVLGLGETLLIRAFPDFNFEIYIKLIFFSFFIGMPLFAKYLGSVFKDESKKFIENIFVGVGLLFSLTLFAPARVSATATFVFQGVCLFMIGYFFYVLIAAMSKRRNGSVIGFIAVLFLIITAVNDILFDNQIIKTGYYAPYGLFLFIFAQSFLLSLKFSNAFKSVEQLSENIIRLNKANSRFVPNQFLSFLQKKSIEDIHLGDNVNKNMTVLFADIRSFTKISEEMSSEEIFAFLNGLLGKISPVIRENNGFIDKYMGDAIMALFPESPDDAVNSAISMLEALDLYNIDRISSDKIPVRIGIGIHTGNLILGTIGEEQRMDGTVISDTVNLASRLEGLSKVYNVNMVVSKEVVDNLVNKEKYFCRFIGKVKVKGKSVATSIYDIYNADPVDLINKKHIVKMHFDEALKLCGEQNYEDAHEKFKKILELHPEDVSTHLYLKKICPILEANSTDVLDDITVMTTK